MSRAIRLAAGALVAWCALLIAAFVLLGLAGCVKPKPKPVPTQFVLSWTNPNGFAPCVSPMTYPCQFSQTVKGATLSNTIAISSTTATVSGTSGTQYQVIINVYDKNGKLVSSKPATVTLP